MIREHGKGLAYMGLPVEILNEKYDRKSYEFNFGMIVGSKKLIEDQNIRNFYEQLLRKMATYLTSLELESEFLFLVEKKCFLAEILNELYTNLILHIGSSIRSSFPNMARSGSSEIKHLQ